MTFLEMQTEVKLYLGNRPDLTTALVKDYISRMYDQISLVFRFYEIESTDTSITTVSGTAAYTTPSGVRVIQSIRDTTNKNRLEAQDMNWYENQDDDSSTSSGKPLNYVRYGAQLLLSPVPDGAYALRIRVRNLPTALSADADTPVFPAEWHEVLVLLAASRASFIFGIETQAMNLKSEALALISSILEDPSQDQLRRVGQMIIERKGHDG